MKTTLLVLFMALFAFAGRAERVLVSESTRAATEKWVSTRFVTTNELAEFPQAVISVNGKTGEVVITAEDIAAVPYNDRDKIITLTGDRWIDATGVVWQATNMIDPDSYIITLSTNFGFIPNDPGSGLPVLKPATNVVIAKKGSIVQAGADWYYHFGSPYGSYMWQVAWLPAGGGFGFWANPTQGTYPTVPFTMPFQFGGPDGYTAVGTAYVDSYTEVVMVTNVIGKLAYVSDITTMTNAIIPRITAIEAKTNNWNTAYGWGNHASRGYLTSFTETDPIAVPLLTAHTNNAAIHLTTNQVQIINESASTNYVASYVAEHGGGGSGNPPLITREVRVMQNFSANRVGYIAADGYCYLANGITGAGMSSLLCYIPVAVTSNNTTTAVIQGIVTNSIALPGHSFYVGAAFAGTCNTNVPPAGRTFRHIGYGWATNQLYFNPSPVFVTAEE